MMTILQKPTERLPHSCELPTSLRACTWKVECLYSVGGFEHEIPECMAFT